MKKIAIIMGSDSDLPIVEKAMKMLDQFEVPYEAHVYSAHRTPEQARIAANTTLPVVGIPVSSGALNGVDALYSTVQMPTGIPVATVAVNGAANAALLCVEMLAICDEALAEKLEAYRKADTQKTLDKNSAVEEKYNH